MSFTPAVYALGGKDYTSHRGSCTLVLVGNSPRSVVVISVNPKLAAIALVICAFARQHRRVELRCRVTLRDNARRTVKRSPTLFTRVHLSRAQKNHGNNVRESDVCQRVVSPRNWTQRDLNTMPFTRLHRPRDYYQFHSRMYYIFHWFYWRNVLFAYKKASKFWCGIIMFL